MYKKYVQNIATSDYCCTCR